MVIFFDKVTINISSTARRKACKILGSFSMNFQKESTFQPTFLWRKPLIQCKVRATYEDRTQIIPRTIFTRITSLFHSVYICYCSDLFRPQFLSIFGKLASLSTFTTYVVSYAKKDGFYISVSEHNYN